MEIDTAVQAKKEMCQNLKVITLKVRIRLGCGSPSQMIRQQSTGVQLITKLQDAAKLTFDAPPKT